MQQHFWHLRYYKVAAKGNGHRQNEYGEWTSLLQMHWRHRQKYRTSHKNAYISWIGSLKLSWFHKYSLAISIHEGKANLTSLGGRGVIKNQRPSNENICKNVLLFTQLVRFLSWIRRSVLFPNFLAFIWVYYWIVLSEIDIVTEFNLHNLMTWKLGHSERWKY